MANLTGDRNRLNDDCTRARRPALGPVLTAQHYAVRINYAREHLNLQLRHWRPILHTDDSSFIVQLMIDLLGCQEERYTDLNIVDIDRYDGGSSWA